MAQATPNPGWCNLAQNRRATFSNNPVRGMHRQPQMPGNMAYVAHSPYFASAVCFKTCGRSRVEGSAWMNPAKGLYLPSIISSKIWADRADPTGGMGLDRRQRWSLLIKVIICQGHHLSGHHLPELSSGQGANHRPLDEHKMLRKIVNDTMPMFWPSSLFGMRGLTKTLGKRRFGLDVNNRTGQPTAPVEFPGMLLGVAKRFGCAYRLVI